MSRSKSKLCPRHRRTPSVTTPLSARSSVPCGQYRLTPELLPAVLDDDGLLLAAGLLVDLDSPQRLQVRVLEQADQVVVVDVRLAARGEAEREEELLPAGASADHARQPAPFQTEPVVDGVGRAVQVDPHPVRPDVRVPGAAARPEHLEPHGEPRRGPGSTGRGGPRPRSGPGSPRPRWSRHAAPGSRPIPARSPDAGARRSPRDSDAAPRVARPTGSPTSAGHGRCGACAGRPSRRAAGRCWAAWAGGPAAT